MMKTDWRMKWSLLGLRLGVFLVMLMWTVDKFINPAHAAKVYEKFYFLPDMASGLMLILGAVELLILLGFLLGYLKRWTYGAVLLFHTVSTFSAFAKYLVPFEGPNLLFFAAWPMLAACLALFLLRAQDTLLSPGSS